MFEINTTWGIALTLGGVKPLLSLIEKKLMVRLWGLRFHSDLAIDKGLLEQLWSYAFGVPPRSYPKNPALVARIYVGSYWAIGPRDPGSSTIFRPNSLKPFETPADSKDDDAEQGRLGIFHFVS